MDVNYAFGPTRLLAAVLALAAAGRSAGADDSVIEVNDQTSMVFVTASDDGEAIQQPASVAGSELVIQQDESLEPASAAESAGPSGQGTLSVVANSQRQGPVSAIIVDSEVVPAVARPRGSGIQSSQHRPGAAGILSGQQRGMPRARTATRPMTPKGAQMPSPSYMTDDEQYYVPRALLLQRRRMPRRRKRVGRFPNNNRRRLALLRRRRAARASYWCRRISFRSPPAPKPNTRRSFAGVRKPCGRVLTARIVSSGWSCRRGPSIAAASFAPTRGNAALPSPTSARPWSSIPSAGGPCTTAA